MTRTRAFTGGQPEHRCRHRFLRDASGVAAAEMALVFPIFALVALNIMDLCMYGVARMQTEQAAQAAVGRARSLCDTAGELPATYPSGHCAGLVTEMTAAAQATSLGGGVTLGTPAEGYYCADAAGNLISVATIDATPPANCSSVVTGSTSAPGIYVSVTASHTFAPFAPGITLMSYLPTSIQQTSWMRLK